MRSAPGHVPPPTGPDAPLRRTGARRQTVPDLDSNALCVVGRRGDPRLACATADSPNQLDGSLPSRVEVALEFLGRDEELGTYLEGVPGTFQVTAIEDTAALSDQAPTLDQ